MAPPVLIGVLLSRPDRALPALHRRCTDGMPGGYARPFLHRLDHEQTSFQWHAAENRRGQASRHGDLDLRLLRPFYCTSTSCRI